MFSPSGQIRLINFEQLLNYYHSSIEYIIFEKSGQEDLKEDLYQEVCIVLWALWKKFQTDQIKYLTSTYVLSTVRNTVLNYLVHYSHGLSQESLKQKRSTVFSLEQSHQEYLNILNLSSDISNVVPRSLIVPSCENQQDFKMTEEKVLAQLDLKEKTFYLLFKQGYSRNEIAKKIKNKNTHWQTEQIKKIRQLFKEYL